MLVGIPLRIENFSGTNKWFLNQVYVDALNKLNISIFPIVSYPSIDYALKCCDALLISGGYDISAFYFNAKFESNNQSYDYPLDEFDFSCLDKFVKAKKPILGICRGLQIINVYFNGTLLQDINTEKHATDNQHYINIRQHSFLEKCYTKRVLVNSHHHQIVGKLGDHLFCSALSDENYVEALEHLYLPIYAVQWHPELDENDLVIAFFSHIVKSFNQISTQKEHNNKD